MNKNSNKSQVIKVLIFVIALIVFALSTTYAYFTLIIRGNPTTSSATTATIRVSSSLELANAISNPKLDLISTDEKEAKAEKLDFTITSSDDSNVGASYYLYLKDVRLSKNLYSEYLKWELLVDNEVKFSGNFKNAATLRKGSEIQNEAFNVLTELNDFMLNTDEEALYLPKTKTQNLSFRLWLENDANKNQQDLADGKFYGRIYLEAIPKKDNNNNN